MPLNYNEGTWTKAGNREIGNGYLYIVVDGQNSINRAPRWLMSRQLKGHDFR